MKKLLKIILRICSFLLGCFLILGGIGGIIASFYSLNTFTAILNMIFTISFFVGGIFLIYFSLKGLNSRIQNNVTPNSIAELNFIENTNHSTQFQNLNASSPSDDNRFARDFHAVQSQPSNSQRTTNEPEVEIPSATDVYIEDNNYGIRHADNSPITDEDVPYLIQLGYEEAMRKHGFSNVEMLDLSHIDEMNKNKRQYTALPTFDELASIIHKTSDITSTDIFFLKYLDGRTLETPDIAQYWYYEYNLNYSNEIKKLISNNLLVLENVNIQKLKVDELKEVLRHFSLPLSGKKLDLQNRIYDNIPYSELSHYFGHRKHYFSPTEKGEQLINSIFDSATKNLELENSCIDLILQYNFRGAYDLIQHFKHNTPAGRQSSSWTYNSSMEQTYDNIMKSHRFYYTLEKDRDLESRIRASVVFCHMYGSGQDNIRKIIKRIYLENGHDFSNDAKNILNYRLL
ncbi:MAG: SAP domain-containing protein [Lachnospiraceae bacterium]|nr:SAP domain-containing protein [Lachnospiraceae bacterium]